MASLRFISLRRFTGWALSLALLWFTVLMARITLAYIPYSPEAAFLQIKQTEVQTLLWYLPVFYTHVYTAIFTLAAGFTQFRGDVLRKHVRLHRALGYLYVICVLLLAAPSGFLMALHANGGWVAQLFFTLLALLWFYTTLQALQTARIGKFEAHRRWMTRSYALALSAITLRLWKLILVKIFHPNPMDVYMLISGLGWIPNLLLAEWLLRRSIKKTVSNKDLSLPSGF